ncbi:MAG: hypothetical protein ACFFAN_16915 [Promethearchaeota archaeon]
MKKPKIGIITDKYHLERKMSEFLQYLKKKAEINIYVEESFVINSIDFNFNEDLFFVKGKGQIILNLIKLIENQTSIPIINSYKGIWLTINRFMNSVYLQKAGIPIPEFSLNPLRINPPFEDYIIKNIIDQKNYSFKPEIEKINGHLHIRDARAINEKEQYQYFFYQQFIKSKWEYKVYAFGEKLFFYKQLPVLVNPNKMETRIEIDRILELEEMTLKAMKVISLKLASIDFLKTKENQFYLTDINSTPNFNYINGGYKIIGDYLLEQAKKEEH